MYLNILGKKYDNFLEFVNDFFFFKISLLLIFLEISVIRDKGKLVTKYTM